MAMCRFVFDRDLRILALSTIVLTCCFVIGPPQPAKANPTFAQFTEASPGGSLFFYGDEAPGNAVFGSDNGAGIGSPIQTDFTYLSLPSLPADLQGVQAATMAMTSSTTAPVVTGFGGTVGSQQINGGGTLTDVISFTRNTPATEGNGTRTNLLTVTFTAQLSGTLGGQTAALTADTLNGYLINYSSDFLSFSPQEEANLALAFTSWLFSIPAGASNLSIDGQTQNFNTAFAAGTGSFAGAPTVSIPEPSSFALASVALLGLLLAARSRAS
jgi:hypothetical protein